MMKQYYDIIIAGAGPAGFSAAIAAARMGRDVLLIEQSDSILGNLTAGPLEAIMTFHDEERQVIKGLAQEFVDRCAVAGGSPGHIEDTTGYAVSITPFAPEISRITGFMMLEEAGVDLILQTCAVRCEKQGRRIRRVEIQSKNEAILFEAEQFVDCTGDGDLAVLAGCSCELGGPDGRAQPMTSLIEFGGVDQIALAKWASDHPEEFCFFSEEALEHMKQHAEKGEEQTLHLWGFYSLLKEGYEAGALSLERKEMHLITGYYPGEVILNYTRVNGDPTSAADRSTAQITAARQGYELWKWLSEKSEPFRDSYIKKIGRIGIRESRRIKGWHCITKEELEKGQGAEHPVAMGAFPMDIHCSDGSTMEFYRVNRGYQIPLESLVAKDVDNLYLAGRCVSCTHEAQASLRITATAMATGQAAGICAAISAEKNMTCLNVDYREIEDELERQKVIYK